MKVPADLRYTKEHEWIRVKGGEAEVGITDYAQGELGDVIFVELPELGSKVAQMKPFGTIDAVKTVSDLFAPVSGEVTAINDALAADPELVNSDPYGAGWMLKLKIADAAQLDDLLDGEAYDELIAAG
jgi:glycine cleavage system H protein